MSAPVLQIRDLTVTFNTPLGPLSANSLHLATQALRFSRKRGSLCLDVSTPTRETGDAR